MYLTSLHPLGTQKHGFQFLRKQKIQRNLASNPPTNKKQSETVFLKSTETLRT